MTKISTSVALCTCNGEKYIREQIESILNNTITVDEIIVCDDISEDNTISILEDILSKSGINYKIIVNAERLGPGLNFQKCIKNCEGEIVFLSDQDDVWKKNKVEEFIHAFQNDNVVCVFSDADIINSSGNQFKESLLSNMVSSDYFPNAFTHKYLPDTMARVQKTPNGCLMAIRKKSFAPVLDDPMCGWHDGWLFHTAALFGEYEYINEKLISYRIHDDNLTSSKAKQEEYQAKVNMTDDFDGHFGLNMFRLARVDLFKHVLAYDFSGRNNRYLKSYEKAIDIVDLIERAKGNTSVYAISMLLRAVGKGCYHYRYADPFCPKGIRFKLRVISVLLRDIRYLMNRNKGK